MASDGRARFALEMGAAAAAAFLAGVTVVWPRWVELGFGLDPDRGDGTFEWLFVGALFSLSLVCSLLAWRDRRANVA